MELEDESGGLPLRSIDFLVTLSTALVVAARKVRQRSGSLTPITRNDMVRESEAVGPKSIAFRMLLACCFCLKGVCSVQQAS